MHRSAPRLTRILACAAAVPALLVTAACSGGSDDASGGSGGGGSAASQSAPSAGGSAAPSVKPSPSVKPAKYSKLPDVCKTVGGKTVEDLVPDVKKKGGTAGESSDLGARASCSWNGLEDKGVKGSDYRWLDVSLLRFESEQTIGSAEERAQRKYTDKVAEVQSTEGAKDVSPAETKGVGDEAATLTYKLKKTGEEFRYAVVVARTENVVITVSYNGTGYAGAKEPSKEDVVKGAQKAAKEVVAAVAEANGVGDAGGTAGPSPSGD
ncbi:DUF3558 domain-containing protein [Streptomyces sp. MUM 203J]|uniref:DUF3558 domain-containing protein n=1 Tax=Streptomyces sp. MUM 203J TaxID=2791990 RepID=UPI001F03ED23|nr:DUF3558 domain-containing protein [Streptomyces sp. MUM 203J]MCH0541381.1 DUF3558 domain-containing protein [Streptomyces sp. MUM 203J]